MLDSGNVLAVQKIELEISKTKRIRRGIIRETPSVAHAFLTARSVDMDLMRRQQRMLNDLNEAMKRNSNTELVALQNKSETARRPVEYLNKLVEEEHTIKRATAEYLGECHKNLGGVECFN